MTGSRTQKFENSRLAFHFDTFIPGKIPIGPTHASTISVNIHGVIASFTSEESMPIIIPKQNKSYLHTWIEEK